MHILLKQTESNGKKGPHPLRTLSVEGESIGLPSIGQSFQLISESLSADADVREVTTSTVRSIKRLSDRSIEFKTLNSTYELEILTGKGVSDDYGK